MERERPSASLHERVGQAIARAAHTQEESHATVAAAQATAAALARTVTEVHHRRRRFGNGQVDDRVTKRAG